ncbi:TetR/AcrR family transcriptional regulator [Streptomyces asiaticus]|uniref:TetR/AcrR family transcriptional regulator n=2 Tax=Streptomyces TaxID=1883 RepID=A0ABN1SI47_9ACTN
MKPSQPEVPPISRDDINTKTMRADARRNRERLIEAARRAFAEQGDQATLEAIATDAGVGIGTLYRHFPTREAMIEAVYRAELTRLCDGARDVLDGQPADHALRNWMDRFADYIAAKREMADVLRAITSSGTITSSQAREEVSVAVQVLLDAGIADGTLRDDVPAQDVVASTVGAFLACGPDQRDQVGRLLDLLMDALRRGGKPPTSGV